MATAPLGSTERTNQLLSEASKITGIKAPTFSTSPGPITQQNEAIKSKSGAVNAKGQIIGSGGEVVGMANAADLPGAGSPRITTPQSTLPEVGPTQPITPGQTNPVPTQAQNNISPSGIPGMPNLTGSTAQQAGQAIDQLKQKYGGALSTLNASGVQAPSSQGAGAAGITTALAGQPGATPEAPSLLGGVMETDSNFDSIFTMYDEFMSPATQKKSLLEEYKQMESALGIGVMNEELIDAKRIIEGTEDDIRAEITAGGGLATDSQVLAMANARNKSLIKNYNYLLESRDNARTQLSTMMQYSIQDRQFAEAEFDRKMNFAWKVAEFKQTATNNARNTYMTLGEKMGWDTLLTTASPYEKSLIQKTLGVSSTALSQLATASAQQRALKGQENALDMQIKQQQLLNAQLTGRKLKQEIDKETPPTTTLTLSKAHSDVQQIDNIIKSSALDSTVGTSFLSRAASGFKGVLGRFTAGAIGGGTIGAAVGAPFGGVGALPGAVVGGLIGGIGLASQGARDTVTGARADLIADVEQLRSSLSLDQLTQAKAEGATFGALDRNEWKVLEGAATKLGTYAIKDEDNNVLGYRASERGFIKEMDKINYYAKLDYILKGGAPEDVGAVVKEDGTVWVQNSDGSVSQLQ